MTELILKTNKQKKTPLFTEEWGEVGMTHSQGTDPDLCIWEGLFLNFF